MNSVRVRALVHRADDTGLIFDLIFEDGSFKAYRLDAYAVRALRGAGPRDIIEQAAIDYYDSLGENVHKIYLTFI